MVHRNSIFINILISIFFCSTALQRLYGQSRASAKSIQYKQVALPTINKVSKRTSYKIDSIITDGIKNNAFPGAQVLVAHKEKIIFHKAYGYHTYDSVREVPLNALYDLASVTKIIGPLPALMKLYEEGKIDLDVPFSTYWPAWKKKKDKQDISLREILAHQAGLQPYIVFLNYALKNNSLKASYFDTVPSLKKSNRVFDSLYIKNSFVNKAYKRINKSPVSSSKKYVYSGLGSLIFPRIIEKISGNSYTYYLQKNFYLPLGAVSLGFKPKEWGLDNDIIPTEKDTLFRKSLIQSWVHDENAALFGGISGNAGLFGTARDLYKVMQMYQNFGTFNGIKYLDSTTVREFTKIQFPKNENRRGLGFDKPYLDNSSLPIQESYPAPSASKSSFGHSGFTGTFVWADPQYQLVFIFLSNRVYPTRDNRNLYNLNIRPKLHQLFYDEISGL